VIQVRDSSHVSTGCSIRDFPLIRGIEGVLPSPSSVSVGTTLSRANPPKT
jgi:hypothetical protein